MTINDETLQSLANCLHEAWETGITIPPLTEVSPDLTIEHAYDVQRRWTTLRQQRGERVIGRKLGMTSRAIQELLGGTEPDHGSLWWSRYFPSAYSHSTIPHATFIQPMLEAEIAFLVGRPLYGPGATRNDVLEATEAVAVAAEVIDTRYHDWRVRAVDAIADNASYGGFTLGNWHTDIANVDLSTVRMRVHRSEDIVIEGNGSASLGHPANAVAWLVNRLAETGEGLAAGDIVLSGSLGGVVPVQADHTFLIEIDTLPALRVTFS